MDNKTTFRELMNAKKIDISDSALFNTNVIEHKNKINFDKIEGMFLGAAIGDSLGITTESMLPKERFKLYGEITDYMANKYTNEKKGSPSDDTQLTMWALEQILKDKSYNPENVAASFTGKRIFGLGSTMRQFLSNFSQGKKWHEAGPKSAGNGSLMRISPMIIPTLKNKNENLWINTALCAMTTHNDSAAIASCLALINLIWLVLDMNTTPEPTFWLDKYIEILKESESDCNYKPRCEANSNYIGTLWQYIDKFVREAYENNLSTVDACNKWYSGAYIFETVPSALYILMKHGDNFEQAMIRAVNDTRDNDTIASIVGGVLGALHGKSKIPERWINNLTGKTQESDDGRIFEILKETNEFLSN